MSTNHKKVRLKFLFEFLVLVVITLVEYIRDNIIHPFRKYSYISTEVTEGQQVWTIT